MPYISEIKITLTAHGKELFSKWVQLRLDGSITDCEWQSYLVQSGDSE